MTLNPQQARVYLYIKDHPGCTMEEVRRATRASKADMRCSETNYKSRKEVGEDLIITTERDKYRWCHKGLNRALKVKEKREGDRLELTLMVR